MAQKEFTYKVLDTVEEISKIYELVKLLAPDLTQELFDERLVPMVERNYRCLVAFDGRRPVAMAAWWILYQFWCGKFMEIDNVVTDGDYRGYGLGSGLMMKLEKLAREEGCEVTLLKVYEDNHGARKFYEKHAYQMPGRVFTKSLRHSPEEWAKLLNSRYES